ncbi:hypothetical protein Tco_0055410, partial [Tanacetum coccineum]
SKERLALPKPRKPKNYLRWSPAGRMFDLNGKLIKSNDAECYLDYSNGDNAYSGCSKHMTGNLKLLINFVWKFLGTVRFGNDHVAAILGYGDLQWGNISLRAWGTTCSRLDSFVIQIWRSRSEGTSILSEIWKELIC